MISIRCIKIALFAIGLLLGRVAPCQKPDAAPLRQLVLRKTQHPHAGVLEHRNTNTVVYESQEAQRALEEQLDVLGDGLSFSLSHSYPLSFSFSYGADTNDVLVPNAGQKENEDAVGTNDEKLLADYPSNSNNWGSETDFPPEKVVEVQLPPDSEQKRQHHQYEDAVAGINKHQQQDVDTNANTGTAKDDKVGESSQGNAVEKTSSDESPTEDRGLLIVFAGAAVASMAAAALLTVYALKKHMPLAGSETASLSASSV